MRRVRRVIRTVIYILIGWCGVAILFGILWALTGRGRKSTYRPEQWGRIDRRGDN